MTLGATRETNQPTLPSPKALDVAQLETITRVGRAQAGNPPPGFVQPPAFGVATLAQDQHGQAVLGVDRGGVDLQRLLESRLRVPEVAGGDIEDAEVVPGPKGLLADEGFVLPLGLTETAGAERRMGLAEEEVDRHSGRF